MRRARQREPGAGGDGGVASRAGLAAASPSLLFPTFSSLVWVDLRRLDEPRNGVGLDITRQISSICFSRSKPSHPLKKSIDWNEELRARRIRARVIYSNPNRRRAEQVEAALQQWDLTVNQPASDKQRFSLHQRWAGNFATKPCAGHVLLVEATKEFFDEHRNAVFVLRGSGNSVHVGKGGEVLN